MTRTACMYCDKNYCYENKCCSTREIEEFETRPICLTVYLSNWFELLKILRSSISLTAISDPHHFHFCPMLCISLYSLSWSVALFLSLSLSLSLHPVSPVVISHKYSADFMRWYHWINLMESKRLFHLGIAHNSNFSVVPSLINDDVKKRAVPLH
jgi:hypothetical protein